MEGVLGVEELLVEVEGNEDPSYNLSGIGSSTRLRRNLHFPFNAYPYSLAIDSTLIVPPFRRPPSHVTQDPASFLTISTHPHLFEVSSPLNVDEVEKFLSIHPNRPLVDSVILGLREGFWPSHDGDFSKLKDNCQGSQSDEDLEFISEEKVEDWELGRLSDPFPTLLPGMHISPTFVVRSSVRKSRTVNDQSISGLNDGIKSSDAKTIYDMIPQLGGLLRYYRHLHLDSDYHFLWKSDVSGAFRNIPVCPEWMIKQVHRVRRRIGGRLVWSYYVDQRLILGNRLSPLIWCTVINLILWCTRIHSHVDHIFIFVDDAFGFDVSGEFLPVFHKPSKETRMVPRSQALVLRVWNRLGIPWNWKKQLFSDFELDVIGFKINATDLSVSLSDSSKSTFNDVTLDFLSADVMPLVKWQRLLGHANWALNILPFAKFSLRSSYKKTRGKERRHALIWINKEVHSDISWMLNEVLNAPPLFLLDPALDDWSPSQADVILYSDACLVASKPRRSSIVMGSGIGFTCTINGARHSFFHRSASPISSIIYAEALGVFSAIVWALETGAFKRILIYCDNAAVVYAFDSGKTSDELFGVIRTTFDLLNRHGCDLRVRHVHGVKNYYADLLSRLDPPTFPFNLNRFGSTINHFDPPTDYILHPVPLRISPWIGRRHQ